MAPSELGGWNSKGSYQRKYLERLKAIHPVVKVPGHFLLTGWLVDKNLYTSF